MPYACCRTFYTNAARAIPRIYMPRLPRLYHHAFDTHKILAYTDSHTLLLLSEQESMHMPARRQACLFIAQQHNSPSLHSYIQHIILQPCHAPRHTLFERYLMLRRERQRVARCHHCRRRLPPGRKRTAQQRVLSPGVARARASKCAPRQRAPPPRRYYARLQAMPEARRRAWCAQPAAALWRGGVWGCERCHK